MACCLARRVHKDSKAIQVVRRVRKARRVLMGMSVAMAHKGRRANPAPA